MTANTVEEVVVLDVEQAVTAEDADDRELAAETKITELDQKLALTEESVRLLYKAHNVLLRRYTKRLGESYQPKPQKGESPKATD